MILSFFVYRSQYRLYELKRKFRVIYVEQDSLVESLSAAPVEESPGPEPTTAPDTWSVDFVIPVHVSGDPERLEAITSTWCKCTSRDMEFILIDGEHGNMFTSPHLPGTRRSTKPRGPSKGLH